MKKYVLKRKFELIYKLVAIFGGGLALVRWLSVFTDIVVINQEINSHISNYSLSLLFYLAIGIIWIQSGVKFSYVVLLGLFLILANIVCETILGIINTPDIIDAIYGIVGVLTGFTFLLVTNKYGLTSK